MEWSGQHAYGPRVGDRTTGWPPSTWRATRGRAARTATRTATSYAALGAQTPDERMDAQSATRAFGPRVSGQGATYGFQSQLVYFPQLQAVLAVATNIETDTQTQPKDVLCFAYNAVAGLLLGQQITCTFSKSSYYGSGCNCTQIQPAPPLVESPLAALAWRPASQR